MVLLRNRDFSALTDPSLLPPIGSNENSTLEQPYNSLGKALIDNLANKLSQALFPTQPFFKMQIDEAKLRKIAQTEDPNLLTNIEFGLSKYERAIMNEIDSRALRNPAFEIFRLLIATGNCVAYLPEDATGMKVYRLDRYVVARDAMGQLLELIIKESISQLELPEGFKLPDDITKKPYENVDVYTKISRVDKKRGGHLWEVSQEIEGVPVDDPKTRGTYNDNNMPWIVLRWNALAGENYGRGMVEGLSGDFYSLEALTKAIVLASALAAKVIFFKKPNGTTNINKLAKARSGDFILGDAKEISVLQLEKYPDLEIAKQTKGEIEQRLMRAFLMMSSIQRQADRVTAEEIRIMAQELETSLGGIYSMLAVEFQLRIIKILESQMSKAKKLPVIDKKLLKPVIITGLEALSRGAELNKLNTFMGQMQPFADVAKDYLAFSDYMKRVATYIGINPEGMVRSESEVEQIRAQREQQVQMAEMAQMMMKNPQIMQGIGGAVTPPEVNQ